MNTGIRGARLLLSNAIGVMDEVGLNIGVDLTAVMNVTAMEFY